MSRLKIILLAIVLTLSVCLTFSCGNGGDSSTPNSNDNVAENNGEVEAQEQEAVDERVYTDVPVVDYGGYVFNVLTFGVTGSEQWENIDMYAEEEIGEVVNDSVYRRNATINEKYNISIQEVHSFDFGNVLRKEIGAGTNEYDLISPRLIDSASFMQSGYFLNLLNVPNLDFTKPWYNQQGVKEMTIDGKLFIVMNDILLSPNDATSIIVFNKQLIKDHGLDDPYALVRDGKWSIDKMYAMAKAVASDVDGDGAMSPGTDRYGYITWNDAMVSFLHSGGQKLVSKDANDLPVITFDNAKTYEVMDKAFMLMYDDNVTGNIQKPAFANNTFEGIFSENRAAFGWTRMYMIPMLRTMEADFGIVPIPKIYESTDGYPSTVNVHHACSLSIPVTTQDMDRTTIIMEALAAESKYTVQPSYYEISLKTKHSRDDESADMLDLILSNRVIDIGDVYNFADFGGQFYQLALKNDSNLTSFYEKHEAKLQKEIDKLITKFAELE